MFISYVSGVISGAMEEVSELPSDLVVGESDTNQQHQQCYQHTGLIQYVKMVDKFAAAIVKSLSIDKLNAEQVFILAMLSLAPPSTGVVPAE